MGRKKTTRGRKPAQATLPKGFQPIGGFGVSWPNEQSKVGEAIGGVVTEYDSIVVTRKRGGKNVKETVNNLKLETENGTVYTVWESAMLKALFVDDYTGIDVWIRFDGMGPKQRGRNPAKLFTIAADLD